MLGLKPWDLERMTLEQVEYRVEWIKRRLKQDDDGGETDG